MVRPARRVNVDFREDMILELDELAMQLNVSRQAVIKTLVRQGLDQRYLAEQGRREASCSPSGSGQEKRGHDPIRESSVGNRDRVPGSSRGRRPGDTIRN